MELSLKQKIIAFYRPSIWAGLITSTKAISHLLILKFVAIKFGASTLGIVGQTMGLASILQNFAGGGISNGVIRNFSLHYDNVERRNEFLSASFIYGLGFSLLMFVACLAIPSTLADLAFGDPRLSWVFLMAAVLSLFSFLASYIQALMTTQGQLRRIFNCQLLSWLISIPVFILLISYFGTAGAIAGLLLNIFFLALFYLFSLRSQPWFPAFRFNTSFRWNSATVLIPFTLITLVTGFLYPSIFILLRSEVESRLGWEYVGYWQSLLKISEVCFSFLSMVIASSFFPNVSKAQAGDQALKQTIHFLTRFMPGLLLGLLLLGIFSRQVLHIVFSADFSQLYEFQRPLLAGDFFRSAGWVLSYLLMARNHLAKFLILETISALLLYLMCFYGLSSGFGGLIIMQAAHSLIYTAMLAITTLFLFKTRKL
jgi:PST family polysaccharide transporter